MKFPKRLTSAISVLTFLASVVPVYAATRPFPAAEDPGSQEKAMRVSAVLDVAKQPKVPQTTISQDLLTKEEMSIVLMRKVVQINGLEKTIFFIRLGTPEEIQLASAKKFGKKDEAYAQQIPPGSTPGSESKALSEEQKKREPVKPPKQPEVAIEEKEGELVPQGFPFLVKHIRFVGNKSISTRQIEKLARPYEGKEISLPELKNVAKMITRLYQTKGFLTSRAFIPPQEIVEGTVTIEILEAKLGEVRVEGNKRIPAKWILKRVQIKSGQVLQVKTLERNLIRMNRNPDVEIRAVLVRGQEPGTTDVILTVKEKFFLHGGYTFDNQGTKFSKKLRQNFDGSGNGILNLNDRVSYRQIFTEAAEFVGEVADYTTPINERGTSAEMTFSNVNIHLGEGLKPLEVRGRATVFSPSFNQSLHESEKWEANLVAGFDFKSVKTRVLGTELSDDELRELHLGPNVTEWDKWGRSVLTTNFIFAFPTFLGASDKKDKHASRPQTGGQFQIYQLTGARVQNLWLGLVGFFRASTQFTPDRLVTAEQFRIGGMNTVRGYPEGDYLGDYGFNGTLELRIPPYLFPKKIELPFNKTIIPRESIQFVLFCDLAKAYLNKPLPTEQSSKLLVGIGPGVLLDIFRHVSARVFMGIPVGDRPTEEDQPRLHFVLTAAW